MKSSSVGAVSFPGRRRGGIMPMIIVAMPVAIAALGAAVDLGLLFIACQQCQVIADAGAWAGAQELPCFQRATAVAQDVSERNVPPETQFEITTNVYTSGQIIPEVGPAPTGGALEVNVSRRVQYYFLPVVGLHGTRVMRSAVTSRMGGSTCVVPLWVDSATPLEFGTQLSLLIQDTPTGIPGSFGFLDPRGGADFTELLAGTATEDDWEAQRVDQGDLLSAYTGVRVGEWVNALQSRIDSAALPPWATDTFGDFRADNPRIMMVPLVRYNGGTGSGAGFEVVEVGAFWLEAVDAGGTKSITGRFIDFIRPGGAVGNVSPSRLMR
ncbi:MAG: hypothetical protein HPY44_08750 [Armatimonadetes bacterium]|nr:hypothetical protein [Armatimonadota bacterium]